MSATEWTPRSRWKGIKYTRQRHNRQYRQAVRRLVRRRDVEAITPPRQTSAKWMVG